MRHGIKLTVMYLAMVMICLGFVGCDGGGGDNFEGVVVDVVLGIGFEGAKQYVPGPGVHKMASAYTTDIDFIEYDDSGIGVSTSNDYIGSYPAEWGTMGDLSELELVLLEDVKTPIATGRTAYYAPIGRLELYLQVVTLRIYVAKTGGLIAEKTFTAPRKFPDSVSYTSGHAPSRVTSDADRNTMQRWIKDFVNP